MPVTLRDIAREVNVSHTTVSLVLNDRAKKTISEATRARVLEAAERLGYRPNHIARALVTGRTHTAAVWTYTPSRPYYASIIRSLQAEGERLGYRMVVSQIPSTLFSDEPVVRDTVDWPVDGIIAMDAIKRIAPYLERSESRNVPIVSIGSYVTTAVDHVAINIAPGIVDAVESLWAAGRKRIAYMTLEAMNETDPRGTGSYASTIARLGGGDERILLPLHGRSAARIAIRDYVAKHGAPGAIIARSDELVIGAFRGLRDIGLRVPEDVALVGCGGIEDILYTDPDLSTIAVPIQQMCQLAWTFLERRLQNPEADIQSEVLPATLVRRGSFPA